MPETQDPRFEGMRRYEPNRRPYVEVREGDHRFHAQVIGWNHGDVFIEYPTKILNRVTTGQREVKWVPTAAAVRIRRADSIWASTEDDHAWHAAEDQRITYRADPWTVYTQEVPE
ncbi:hypothetical protein [Glutamicibacter creatinolyticus]|uniref:hypothetical protein n=1 Tax=Glutamicibacter creatinolyticus TaxID=162496 RepID=UPI0032166EAF